MTYLVNPIPYMRCQRFFNGVIPGLMDPNCTFYCFEAFLIYWYEKVFHQRLMKIKLTRQKKIGHSIIG